MVHITPTMLTSIGRGAKDPDDLVTLLLECHARIRHFVRLAAEVGTRLDLSEGEVRDECARVRRYFGEALPLHVRDEEESLLPRLLGHETELDAALEAMHAQHLEHAPALAGLLRATAALEKDPHDADGRTLLGETARTLAIEFETHLSAEEATILPAIPRLLDWEGQRQVVAELRARRS